MRAPLSPSGDQILCVSGTRCQVHDCVIALTKTWDITSACPSTWKLLAEGLRNEGIGLKRVICLQTIPLRASRIQAVAFDERVHIFSRREQRPCWAAEQADQLRSANKGLRDSNARGNKFAGYIKERRVWKAPRFILASSTEAEVPNPLAALKVKVDWFLQLSNLKVVSYLCLDRKSYSYFTLRRILASLTTWSVQLPVV